MTHGLLNLFTAIFHSYWAELLELLVFADLLEFFPKEYAEEDEEDVNLEETSE